MHPHDIYRAQNGGTPENGSRSPVGNDNRRRSTLARSRLKPDARELRPLLADIQEHLNSLDEDAQRRVRTLVGQIVARLIETRAPADIELAIVVKRNAVRVDIWRDTPEPSDFFEKLDEAIFLDLVTSWGRDRRRPCGAWFELDQGTQLGAPER